MPAQQRNGNDQNKYADCNYPEPTQDYTNIEDDEKSENGGQYYPDCTVKGAR